jgi:TetR/AcrR family tetracycline transcriptional repressor
MPLSRDEVIQGALDLLEEHGMEGLTMRRLAKALGVQAGAIYWHFKDRQDLEDAMADDLLKGVTEPKPTGRWDQQVAELTRRITRGLMARRHSAQLIQRALKPGPHGLAASEALIHAVRAWRQDEEITMWATSVIGYFVLGYVTDVQATEEAKARGMVSIARDMIKKLDKKAFPEITALGEQSFEHMMTTRSHQTRFDFGLEVMLRGLKAAARSAPKRRRTKRPPKRG